jgi:hypothetical protein
MIPTLVLLLSSFLPRKGALDPLLRIFLKYDEAANVLETNIGSSVLEGCTLGLFEYQNLSSSHYGFVEIDV